MVLCDMVNDFLMDDKNQVIQGRMDSLSGSSSVTF